MKKTEDDTAVPNSISLSLSLFISLSPPREMVKDRKRDGKTHASKTSRCDLGVRKVTYLSSNIIIEQAQIISPPKLLINSGQEPAN